MANLRYGLIEEAGDLSESETIVMTELAKQSSILSISTEMYVRQLNHSKKG